MVRAGELSTEIEYPSEDGKPMAESDFQLRPLTYAVEALGIYFQDRPNVYVSGDLFVYYEKGNPEAVVAPDVVDERLIMCLVQQFRKRSNQSFILK